MKLSIALLAALATSAPFALFANEDHASAIELLSAYTGQSAHALAPYFRYSDEARIVGVDIHAVGIDATIARYSGQEPPLREVNNILRIRTADGFEGVSGVDSYHEQQYSDAHLQALRDVVAELPGLRSLDPVEIARKLAQLRPETSDAVRASIDIALWDLAARKAGLPINALLGARRESIESYASLPFYESLPEYVDAVHEYAKFGHTTFKFHVWGSIEQDLELVDLIQRTFADSPYRFMVDLESVYDLNEALRLGEKLDDGLFIWFEAPVNDSDLEQYAELKRKLGQQVIPAGYNIYSPEFITAGIEADAWDAGRFDVTTVGGLTPALELMAIANDRGLPIEIQSWGHTLTQVVNLHLMLANDRTEYFEAPMPKEAFEFGMRNGNLLVGDKAVLPDAPGLGIEVDWGSLDDADFHVHLSLEFAGPED